MWDSSCVCVSRFEDTREHQREGTDSFPWLLHQNHPCGRCWGVETRIIRVGTYFLLRNGIDLLYGPYSNHQS
ncbi:hypothetical protein VNO80_03342 [Phaseolus coccineus]|uniref:Uncharacterized protein n=1 Tax=Phaseolus coccineus TaxID=3886 RepID=A0AAN9NS09_PHACN